MNTDAILERVLDRLDKLSEGLASLTAQTGAAVDRLDKINGSVGRHEQALNENKLWQAAQESKPRISDKTVLQVAAMICGTVLTVYGAQVSGLAQTLVALMK